MSKRSGRSRYRLVLKAVKVSIRIILDIGTSLDSQVLKGKGVNNQAVNDFNSLLTHI